MHAERYPKCADRSYVARGFYNPYIVNDTAQVHRLAKALRSGKRTEVYVVTVGDYSDYKIKGVFDNKELAELFIDTFATSGWGWSPTRIEIWQLNPLEPSLRAGFHPWQVLMKKDGTMLSSEKTSSTWGFFKCDGEERETTINRDGDMFTHVMARDQEHAVKVANERRIRLVAGGAWPEKK